MNRYICLLDLRREVNSQEKSLEELKRLVWQAESRLRTLNSAIEAIKMSSDIKGLNQEGFFPCKKCGGKPVFSKGSADRDYVVCSNDCGGGSIEYSGDKLDGIDRWNDKNRKK